MPFFDFSAPAESSIVKPRFWFYWVIAGPLTVITLIMYGIYVVRSESKRREEEQRVSEKAAPMQLYKTLKPIANLLTRV